MRFTKSFPIPIPDFKSKLLAYADGGGGQLVFSGDKLF